MSAPSYQLFVGGGFVAAAGAERIERLSPASGRLVASYARATRADVEAAVASARAAFARQSWRGLTPAARSDLLLRCADAIERDGARLAASISDEVGKSAAQARAEVAEGCALWRHAAASLRSIHGEFHPRIGPGHSAHTFLEPVGVVALILPWNFPFIVSAERLPYILAAGCGVVVKPSEHAGGASFLVAEALASAGVPPGVHNVVSGLGPDIGEALVAAPGVDMVSFTGSTENGRRVAEVAARGLKRVSLELGGKSPVIVFEDADLEAAVEGIVSGFTYNAGQCCIATSRLLVHRSVAAKLERLLAARLGSSDEPLQPAATRFQHDRVVEMAEIGMREGRVVTGGFEARPPAGTAIAPMVVADLSPSSRLAREEVFGPVLSMFTFDSEEEAVNAANDTQFGLAACIWTRDERRAARLAREVRAGRLWINSPQVNFPELPVGGFGASGIGREAGSAGIRTYSEIKSVIVKS